MLGELKFHSGAFSLTGDLYPALFCLLVSLSTYGLVNLRRLIVGTRFEVDRASHACGSVQYSVTEFLQS